MLYRSKSIPTLLFVQNKNTLKKIYYYFVFQVKDTVIDDHRKT